MADTDEVSAEALYNALLSDYPDHRPGTRPVHAIGIGAIGFFAPSSVAGVYSAAPHFAGGRVPVTVRYSNGSGSRVERDHDLDGMSVKFHFANVHTRGGEYFFLPSIPAVRHLGGSEQ